MAEVETLKGKPAGRSTARQALAATQSRHAELEARAADLRSMIAEARSAAAEAISAKAELVEFNTEAQIAGDDGGDPAARLAIVERVRAARAKAADTGAWEAELLAIERQHGTLNEVRSRNVRAIVESEAEELAAIVANHERIALLGRAALGGLGNWASAQADYWHGLMSDRGRHPDPQAPHERAAFIALRAHLRDDLLQPPADPNQAAAYQTLWQSLPHRLATSDPDAAAPGPEEAAAPVPAVAVLAASEAPDEARAA